MENTEKLSTQEKRSLERNWVASGLGPEAKWHELHTTYHDHAYCGKEYVVFRLAPAKEGVPAQPVLLQLFRVKSISATDERGVRIRMIPALGDDELNLVHTPTQIADFLIYVWVPAFAELRFAPINYKNPTKYRRLSCPISVRLGRNPRNVELQPDTVYFLSRNEFAQIWPAIII